MAIAPEHTGTRASDVLARVEEENVEFVRLWFTDIFGRLKSFAIGQEELGGALEQGMGFDGSSITGFNRIEESDMIAMPDPSTFRILPWRDNETGGVGRLFCDVLTPDGEPYSGDPRFQMRRALARAQEMGFDHFYLGPELEFFLFKDDESTQVLDKGGYFDLTTLDVASDFRRDCVRTLRKLGIDVEYSHHEVGPSQHEIDIRFADGLEMADNAMTYRIAVKEVASEHGCYATFMPKPLLGENGSGMHVHQSLFRGSENAFFDADDEYFLSDTAKAFIAGQLRHARELSALFAPSVNSYKRLVPGYEAPVYIGWSRRNRSALVRVPVYHPGKERATRMELRCPDPSCNPYLTFAALLHAGLDGIEKGYELPAPIERNLYDLTEEERRSMGIEHLPESLGEAIEELAGSELAKSALGEHIHSRYVELKRKEWLDYRIQVTPWEIEQYLPVT
ncbi:MAG TPA: glutamine synthetase family protein [Thermoleophilaceae bacterium]|nr:glutamine synthetase family protein [Thermoleophilaceae bacterium]